MSVATRGSGEPAIETKDQPDKKIRLIREAETEVPSGHWRHHLYSVSISHVPQAMLGGLYMGVALLVFLLLLWSGALAGIWLLLIPLLLALFVARLFRQRTASRLLMTCGCVLLLLPSAGFLLIPFVVLDLSWGEVMFRRGETGLSWGAFMVTLDLVGTLVLYFLVGRYLFDQARWWRRNHESRFPEI